MTLQEKSQGSFPHCDSKVLHHPDRGCVYCNAHADWQEERIRLGINFTGEQNREKLRDPAELARPLENIENWGGNVVHDAARQQATEEYWASIDEQFLGFS